MNYKRFDDLQEHNKTEVFAVSIDAGGPYSLVRDDPALPAAQFNIETIMYIQDSGKLVILSLVFGVNIMILIHNNSINTSYESKFGFRNSTTMRYNYFDKILFDMDVSDSLFGDSDKVVAASLTGGYGLFHGRLPIPLVTVEK